MVSIGEGLVLIMVLRARGI